MPGKGQFPCLQSKGSGSSLNRENLPVWKMFPFLDEREKYKIRPSSGKIKVKQSKVHAASKGSADAGGISSGETRSIKEM